MMVAEAKWTCDICGKTCVTSSEKYHPNSWHRFSVRIYLKKDSHDIDGKIACDDCYPFNQSRTFQEQERNGESFLQKVIKRFFK